jgi:hypothetical protein
MVRLDDGPSDGDVVANGEIAQFVENVVGWLSKVLVRNNLSEIAASVILGSTHRPTI